MSLALVPTPDEDRLATLGGRIQSARFERRWDQDRLVVAMKALAAEAPDRHLAVSRRTLSDWENNKKSPTAAHLATLGAALGKRPSWFIEHLDAIEAGPDGGPGLGAAYPPWDSNPEPAD